MRRMELTALAAALLAASSVAAGETRVPGKDGLCVVFGDKTGVAPNSLSMMTCEAKRLGAGTVLCGTGEVSCDDSSSWDGWKRKCVIFRTSAGSDQLFDHILIKNIPDPEHGIRYCFRRNILLLHQSITWNKNFSANQDGRISKIRF